MPLPSLERAWWGVLTLLVAMMTCTDAAHAQRSTIRVETEGCTPSWWNESAFRSALGVELAALEMDVTEDAPSLLTISVPCARQLTIVQVRVVRESVVVQRDVALIDVDPFVRTRALALAAHDAIQEAWAIEIPVVVEAPVEVPVVLEVEPTPTPIAPVEEAPPPAPQGTPSDERVRLEIGAHGFVMVPAAAIGGGALLGVEVPLSGLPFSILARTRFGYAEANDALGRISGITVDGIVGARAWLDVDVLRLAAEVAVAGSYLRIEGQSARSDVAVRSVDAFGLAIEAHARGTLAITRDVGVTLAVGVRGFVIGSEGRAEGRTPVGFVGALPSASLEVVLSW